MHMSTPTISDPNVLKYLPCDDKVDILLVGDSPTNTELYDGRPFQAEGSMFVRKVMEQICKEYSSENNADDVKVAFGYASWRKNNTKQGIPTGDIKEFRPILEDQINRQKPKVIICLGSSASFAVAKTRAGIIQARGQWQWHNEFNAYVMLTFHPSYIMSSTGQYITWAKDLTKAVDLLTRKPGKIRPNPIKLIKVYTITSEEKAIAFLRFLRKEKRIVASDIETRGFNFRDDKLLCQGFTYREWESYVLSEEMVLSPSKELQAEMKLTIESDNIYWLYHNGKFDNKFHRAQRGMRARTDMDTMLLHYALDVRKGTHDLEQLAIEYLGAEPWEHEAHKYVKESFADIPRDILYHYQGVDTAMTFGVYHALMEEYNAELAKGRKIDKLVDLLMKANEAYLRMEMNGHHVSLNQVNRLYEEYEPRMKEAEEKIMSTVIEAGWNPEEFVAYRDEQKLLEWTAALAKEPNKKKPGRTALPKKFNVNSYVHLRYMLYKVWGLKPFMKKGKISSDAESLEAHKQQLEEQNNVVAVDFIEAKLAYAKDKKMFSTYIVGIDKIIDKSTERAHTTFKLHGTETGRLSSAEPNFHNIPRQSDIKNIFDASPGYVLIQSDYSQAELRVLAAEGNDPWLRQVYIDGRDLHDAIAEQMFGPNFTKEQRVRAKAVNFGIAYGRTGFTLAREFNISKREGDQLIDDWYKPQPLTEAWINARRNDPIIGNVFETPTGRVRNFGLVTERTKNAVQNEAVNFPIQSEASDCMVWSIYQMLPELDAINEREGREVVRLVNSVHDSVITEIEKDHDLIQEVIEIQRKWLTSAAAELLNTDVPFICDFEIGRSWGALYDYTVKDGQVFGEGKDGLITLENILKD